MSGSDQAPTDSESLRELLRSERERTIAQITALMRDFEEIVASAEDANVDDEHDPEGSTIAWERQKVAALLDQAQSTLVELDSAAERVADGTYGICERCGRPIAGERLLARPTARRCVDCA